MNRQPESVLCDGPLSAALQYADLAVGQPNVLQRGIDWIDSINREAKKAGLPAIIERRKAPERPEHRELPKSKKPYRRLLVVRRPNGPPVEVPLWIRKQDGDVEAVRGALRAWQQQVSPPVAEATNRAVSDPPSPPLTDALREMWEALDGRALTGPKLAKLLNTSDGAILQRAKRLKDAGYPLENTDGLGYWRTDAPPE